MLRAPAIVVAVCLLALCARAGLAVAQAPPTKASTPSGWGATVESPVKSVTPSLVSVEMRLEGRRTLFSLELTRKIDFHLYTLDQPYRVILDAGHMEFKLPSSNVQAGNGIVAAYRYGLLAAGQSRVVIDTTGPVATPTASWRPAATEGHQTLVIALEPIDATAFKRTPLPQIAPAAATMAPEVARPTKPGRRRVVVIDPGHGGIDPGATGMLGPHVLEKDIVLAVSHQLRQLLLATNRYEIVMTRTGDTFVPLDQRVKISLQHHADLFISIHADSVGAAEFSGSVRGATVYTLSENASDERARQLAEKENASDILAGVDVSSEEGSDQVRSILIDLLKRESANFSIDFRSIVVRHLQRQIVLAREPQRSAAFRVLRQTHAPSVLVELGYLSHAEDVRLLGSADWQGKVASTIAAAVNEYFSPRTSKRR